MEQRRRIKYLVLQAVSIVIFSPVPTFGETFAIPGLGGAVAKSSRSPAENLDEAPLSLSLSSSMSSPSTRQVGKLTGESDMAVENRAGANEETKDEPLLMSLSPSLSPLSIQLLTTASERDLVAQAKDNMESEFTTR